MQSDREAIDALVAQFYDAFTNRGGVPRNIDILHAIFMPEAIIVNNVAGDTKVSGVSAFIEPRREILSNGSLQDFREWETAETTEVFAHVAQRFSRYEKSWIASGQTLAGAGVKSLQFVRTEAGWKICALAWDDVP